MGRPLLQHTQAPRTPLGLFRVCLEQKKWLVFEFQGSPHCPSALGQTLAQRTPASSCVERGKWFVSQRQWRMAGRSLDEFHSAILHWDSVPSSRKWDHPAAWRSSWLWGAPEGLMLVPGKA